MPPRSAFARRMGLSTDPLWLMDGSAFMFRGFYANQSMQRSDGFPTNALFMMARVVLRVLREERPEHFCVVLDGKGKHFRHEIYPPYKAQRLATPEPLKMQFEPIRRMLTVLGVPLAVSEGCEADDCIASLVARHKAERPVVIVGTDKDLRQCLAPGVILWDPVLKDEKVVTLESFMTEEGVDPARWPDVQAVIGDSSDNIPGIPGVGPKTAKTVFERFKSLEDIRDNFKELPEKLQNKFGPHLDQMFVYRQLTTLRTDQCTELDLKAMRVKPLNTTAAMDLLKEFELRSLMRDVQAMLRDGILQAEAEPVAEPSANRGASTGVQASLFDLGPARGGTAADATTVPGAPITEDPAKLPDCADRPVAVVPRMAANAEGGLEISGWHVAVDEEEWLYTGIVDGLVKYLEAAAQIVVPDLKALLRGNVAWKRLEAPKGGAGPVCSRFLDLGLAAYLLNPEERDYSWPHLAKRFSDELDLPLNSPAALALEAASVLTGRLNAAKLTQLLRSLEQPLVPVLAAMEEAGIALDKAAFAGFLAEVQRDLDRLTADIYKEAGGPFNIRSSQQLGELLFSTLKLPSAGKTRGGQISTAQEVLEKLSGKHPVVDAVLEFRKLEKLRSTYLEPLPPLADAAGRIHTTFNQKAAATGRLSSSEPNLQNIPVRGDQGRRMRACFTAGPGLALVSADYSQVELRVLAHMSQDQALLDAFHEKDDIHRRTAALIYDLPPDQVGPDQRRNAKTINFGLIYGMGPQKLAQELRVTLPQAKEFIERYFSRLQKLGEFYEQTEASAKEHGFVTTLAGRRRLLPEIHSANSQLQSQARRQAINTLIQGSAADIIKLAMLAAFTDKPLQEMGARLILQIHDELLFEAPPEKAHKVGERVAEIMSGVKPGGMALAVPLAVDWGTGGNWGDAH